MPDALERLEMAREILAMRQGEERAPQERRRQAQVLANRRISAIRRVLLGRPGATLADELMTPATAYPRLRAMLEGASAADLPATEAYVRKIFPLLRGIESAEKKSGLRGHSVYNDDVIALTSLSMREKRPDTDLHPLIDAHVARGRLSTGLHEELAAAVERQAVGIVADIKDLDPQLGARYQQAMDTFDAGAAALREARTRWGEASSAVLKAHQDKANDETIQRLMDVEKAASDDYDKALKVREKKREANNDLSSQVADVYKRAREQLTEPVRTIGQSVIDSIKQQSPVTPEQAGQWAKAQIITKAATARLKKQGYMPEKMQADLAEFYHLTGGRITQIKIDTIGLKRAKASDIKSDTSAGVIYLDSDFGKRTLWHELAHHIEADPVAGMAALAFIRRRSDDGEKVHSLKRMTGNPGYRNNEVAFKDSFFDPYVGKYYGEYDTTEVFSMGVESFSDPLLLGRRMAQDPETLAFVTGFIKGAPPALAMALQSIKISNGDANTGLQQDSATAINEIIKKLAERTEIIADTDTSWVYQDRPAYHQYFLSDKAQIGRFATQGPHSGLYLFSGKAFSAKRRKVNGLLLVSDTGGTPDYTAYPTKDTLLVKAAATIYSNDGRLPSLYDLNREQFLRDHL